MDNASIKGAVMQFYTNLQYELNALLNEVKQATSLSTVPSSRLLASYCATLDNDTSLTTLVWSFVAEGLVSKVKNKLAAVAENVTEAMHHGFETALHHTIQGTMQFFVSVAALEKATPAAQQVGLVLLGSLLYFRLAANCFEHPDITLDPLRKSCITTLD
uniref:Protein SEY1 n=1 Tax=Lygus hesperus TaxID=30085 RepID=A0A146L6E9_LYGHE